MDSWLFFFCFNFNFWIAISQVTQTPVYQDLNEGDRFTITCKINAEYSYFHWYRQVPGRPLSYICSITSSRNVTKEGLTAEYLDKGQRSRLHFPSSLLQDSGTYFCGVSGGSNSDIYKLIFGSGTRLVVTPNLRNSTPSVYQLETKENLTACLITDYSPNSIKVKDHNNMKTVDGSVVVVKDDHENPTSLGAVIWRQKKDQFQCSVEHSGLNYKAENEGDGCSETQSSTPVFETDERLNLLSLTVLGLRLIFFKSVALNLILTFWAWSR